MNGSESSSASASWGASDSASDSASWSDSFSGSRDGSWEDSLSTSGSWVSAPRPPVAYRELVGGDAGPLVAVVITVVYALFLSLFAWSLVRQSNRRTYLRPPSKLMC